MSGDQSLAFYSFGSSCFVVWFAGQVQLNQLLANCQEVSLLRKTDFPSIVELLQRFDVLSLIGANRDAKKDRRDEGRGCHLSGQKGRDLKGTGRNHPCLVSRHQTEARPSPTQ